MDLRDSADMFKALGDPTRLKIVECLMCCDCSLSEEGEVAPLQGPTAGEVCCQITGDPKVTSTISFHLKELRNAGIIQMEKRGKNMICCIDRNALRKLAGVLQL